MPSIQQLRYLVAVADTLSFSRAAEFCHVTQPTLSMQVKELEARLGSQLVERTRARVFLTPVGSEIARRARSILAEVEDIREIARRDDPNALQGTLQMGVVQTVGAYVLSLAMPSLRGSFPHLRVVVREDRLETLPRKLSDGVHDVLLLPDDPNHADFTSVRLIREPLHLVLPADHRLAARETVRPEDLAGETILTMERGHRLHDRIAALCREVGAIHARDYAGTTLDTLRQMVATGMGLSLLPALYVRSDVLREKLVVARPLTRGAPVRDIMMVWRRSSPRQSTYALLAETIRTCLLPWEEPEQQG
ncbi:hydrogen peroxide-inducible genes activator [Azospirillum picis]|uniref:LysR family hydrogen peroxide-inducible transcriptional activator n=1 Tax=Azospirillum picis TaxID=488438 RepID=A0ABU0MSC2_9PROT|nr:hydrogen peroxide-inducible genes activator [Azospirillum picis]MBP2301934.1 LysR family hydrogen peroxide-inducible transcriptional activator [Azospirillum picis]MDQ0536383.1 LysR family hydrogen peroxide-inducible transcriptional activator [Azospirillum picis]